MGLLQRVAARIGRQGLASRLDRDTLAKALAAAGYLDLDGKLTPANILKAVEAFQSFNGLKVDGLVGFITGRLLLSERACDCPDRMELRGSAMGWNHAPIRVATNIRQVGKVSSAEINQIFAVLIDQLESESGIRFQIVNNYGTANILLTSERIDGNSGVLGDQYLPLGVDASSQLLGRLDSSERFVNSAKPGIGEVDIVGTIAHETFGHGIGLRHSAQNGPDSLMKPYKTALRTFQEADLIEVRQLYPGSPKRAEPGGPVIDLKKYVAREEVAVKLRKLADEIAIP